MDLNFISQLSPELRNAILKLQNANINDEQEDIELEKIAAQIVEDESDNEKSQGVPKLNIDKALSSIEKDLYAANLSASDTNSISLGSKGVSNNSLWDISVLMLNQLISLGIVKYDGSKITSFDSDLASRILDMDVTDWDDFKNKFCENSYSYVEDLQNFSDANLRKYFVGPLLQYASKEDANNNEYNDLRYALNFDAILKDFGNYSGRIDTPKDLLLAIQWKSQNDIGVNGKIDEDIQQGYIGDCWLLSGVLAMSSTEEGVKAISDAIKVKTLPDGKTVVEVEFKGVFDAKGKPIRITITPEEIAKYDSDLAGAELFSTGDNDMLVLELATNKLEEMLRNGEAVTSPEVSALATTPEQFDYRAYSPDYINSFLEGSDASRLIYMLTGAIPDFYFDELTRNNIYQILQNAAENPGTIMSFGLFAGEHAAKTVDGGAFEFNLEEGGHAFAVTDVKKAVDRNGNVDYDKSTVTFVNPWDSSEKITVSWKEFVNLDICTMSSTSLSEQIDGTTDKPATPSPLASGEGYDDNKKISIIAEDFENGNLTVKQLMALLVKIDSVKNAEVKYEGSNTIVTITIDDGEVLTLSCNTNAVKDGLIGLGGKSLKSENSVDNDVSQVGMTGNNHNTFEFETLELAVQELGLRKTFCKDVYSENSSYGQKRYLWNETNHTMTEI